MNASRLAICSLVLLWLAGCASSPGGGYYGNDGPPVKTDIDLSSIPPAVPKPEPLSRFGNPRSYTVFGKTYYPMRTAKNFTQTGVASWYGRQFHGKRTSSGEAYDMYRMTAAHKTLPLPSYVRVTNRRSGKQVIVRVNDRGPFRSGRIIDLSYVAALKLGIVRRGSAPVRIETVTAADVAAPVVASHTTDTPPTAQPTRLTNQHTAAANPAVARSTHAADTMTASGRYLQVGAFAKRGNADQIAARLRRMGIAKIRIAPAHSEHGTLYRVRVGPFSKSSQRRIVRQRLTRQGLPVIPVRQRAVR